MAIHSSIPEVSFSEAVEALLTAHAANIPVLLLGDPGVGKSALARIVSQRLELPLVTLLGSTCDPTDIGGLPVKNASGSLDRVPLKMLRDAADAPRILFLDEISCAPPAVQASLLRLMLERIAGDVELHAQSWIMSAANPPEQAPGGFELSAPLMGRVCVLHLRPTLEEVLNYFKGLGEDGSVLRLEATDWALTVGLVPSILEIDIPSACVAGNIPWGAPRAWERAIRARAAGIGRTVSADSIYKLTAGNVGDTQATAYQAILKLRQHLPTVDNVLADPAGAKVPAERQHQIAAVGLVPRVAALNTWAGWIYSQRLIPEIGAACASHLEKCKDSAVSAPFAREGVQARVKLSSLMRAA